VDVEGLRCGCWVCGRVLGAVLGKAALWIVLCCVTYLEVSCTSQHGQYDGEGVFRVDEGDVEDWACVY
jgi:hypothetical protein